MSSFLNWIEKCFPQGDVLRQLSDYENDFSGEEWKNTNLSTLFKTNFVLPGSYLEISRPA